MKTPLLFLLLSSFAAGAAAQNTSNLDESSREPARPAATDKKAAGAAQAAREAEPTQGGEVTYEQILKNPDDVALNRRYAQQQIRKGDLRGASSTMERLAMLRPNDPSVRLLFGVVLYRLDDAVAAERELKAVLAMPNATSRMQREARDYLALARKRQKNLHFDARLTVGLGYDDNVNSAPDGDVVLFSGTPLVLPDVSRRKEDSNVQFIGSLGASYDLGGPKGHTVFTRVTHFRGEQHVYNLLDLQAYSVEGGAVLRTRWAELRPVVSFDHVLLSQSTYLRNRTLGLRAERKLHRGLGVFAEFNHADQDFVNTPLIAAAEQREGDQFDYELGTAWTATPTDRLTLSGVYRRKFARTVSNAYSRKGASLEWLHLMRKGAFLVATIEGQFDRYEVADSFVDSRVIRHDEAGRFELLTGAPMSFLWAPLHPFTLTLGYEHFRQGSNIVNYDYTNNRLSLLVSYQWGI